MARYKVYSYDQGMMIPVDFSKQIGDDAEKLFTKEDCTYDKVRDIFTCPAGKILKYSGNQILGNIRCCKGLTGFTLRSKAKVNVQWVLYTIVHNIEKITKYGVLKGL